MSEVIKSQCKKNELEIESQTNKINKIMNIAQLVMRILLLIGVLYIFILSLGLMTTSFKLIGGTVAGKALSKSSIISNPIAGLIIGMLVTVLVQSSSTTTSIVVTMVGTNVLSVSHAIPLVMGANIGTSVTNVLVSFGQIRDNNQFGKSFSGATIHDVFNFLSVLIFLPIEVITSHTTGIGYIEFLAYKTTFHLNQQNVSTSNKMEFIETIFKPVENLIIQLNHKTVINQIAQGGKNSSSILNYNCKIFNSTKTYPCGYLFAYLYKWPDHSIGILLLFISVLMLTFCIIGMVKILYSLVQKYVNNAITKFINSDLPGCLKYFTGYIAILVATICTIILQSSSVFTSMLTPLVGVGLITLERAFPLTLGANLGTTITAILAALTIEGNSGKYAMEIALCHLYFNVNGVLLWYPFPFMRKVPLKFAITLGETCCKYPWFGVVYLIVIFFLIPGILFGLSMLGWNVVLGFVIFVIFFILVIAIINLTQNKFPQYLPLILQNWQFLPIYLRSLEPYNKAICKLRIFKKKKYDENPTEVRF